MKTKANKLKFIFLLVIKHLRAFFMMQYFANDIWGDTVNTASRMESNVQPGKVNISETTYQLVKDEFECTYRGKINAKGKGEVDMYFVENDEL